MTDIMMYNEYENIKPDDTKLNRRIEQEAVQRYKERSQKIASQFIMEWGNEVRRLGQALDIPPIEIEAWIDGMAEDIEDTMSFSIRTRENEN